MKQMKNKRIIALALCVATVMSSCLMFSSTTPYDENLLNAAAITRKIFHANLTEEKKEKQKEFGTVAAQYLKGLDDSEDYILAQKNTREISRLEAPIARRIPISLVRSKTEM